MPCVGGPFQGGQDVFLPSGLLQAMSINDLDRLDPTGSLPTGEVGDHFTDDLKVLLESGSIFGSLDTLRWNQQERPWKPKGSGCKGKRCWAAAVRRRIRAETEVVHPVYHKQREDPDVKETTFTSDLNQIKRWFSVFAIDFFSSQEGVAEHQ